MVVKRVGANGRRWRLRKDHLTTQAIKDNKKNGDIKQVQFARNLSLENILTTARAVLDDSP
jgi:hypothetical protein